MRAGVSLGRWFGVPVILDLTWLLLAAYVTYAFVAAHPAALHSTTERYTAGVITSLLLAASVLLHELGHAISAQAMGLPVRRITLYLLGGASEIEGDAPSPGKEYLVAGAGPLVSIVLGAAGAVATIAMPSGIARDVIQYVTVLNVMLAIFNLLPGLPLDGGRLVRSAVWAVKRDPHGATIAAAQTGRVLGAILIASPLLTAFEANGWEVLVPALVGLFISLAARQALTRANMLRVLPTLSAGKFARRLAFLPVSAPVSELTRAAQQRYAGGVALVDSRDRVVALVDETAVLELPDSRRAWVTADEVAQRLERWHVIDISLSGEALLEHLRATGAPLYLVMVGERPYGMLAAADVVAAVERATR